MKKTKKVLLAAIVATAVAGTCAAALSACTKPDTHDHDYSGVEYTPDADGKTHSKKCKVDGCKVVTGTEEHDYEVNTTEATCTSAKTVVSTCKVCHYSKTETVGGVAHTWGEWTLAETPTADKSGKATRKCDDCDTADSFVLTIPQLLIDGEINPVYDYWVVENTADCENDGTATYTYVNAEYDANLSFTGETPTLGHNWNERFDSDEDNHYITCTRNAEHIKPDSTEAHTKQTSQTASLIYNLQSGKWEHVYFTTCEQNCGYKKEVKGEEADRNDGGAGVSLTTGSTTAVGSGTHSLPFTISAHNTREYTVTIPANTVVSLRYTDIHAMGIYAVSATDSDNLSVIYGERIVAVEAGERAKSDPYIGERGGSLDFALTTTNGEAATVKFRFFDNDHYSVTGNPSSVEAGTEYTDEVPLETDVVHTFVPTNDGLYTFTVTGGEIMLENGRDLLSAGSRFTEPLYFGKSYTITVYTGLDRSAGTVKFKIVREGDIPEPAEGSISKPQAITEVGEYEVSGIKFFAFTPSQSGYYVFCDTNSSVALYSLNTDSEFANQLTSSIFFANTRDYSYIEYELNAGTTYYLNANAGSDQIINMTISLHNHTFNTAEWSTDGYSHWRVSTCGHNVKGSLGGHAYNENNICTVCNYEKIEMVTEGLLFELSGDGTYYIVSMGSATATEIYIPSTYGESGSKLPVKEIKANGFANKADVTSISVPSSITKIGANAFQYCTSITSVYITDLNAWAQIDFGGNTANPFFAYVNLEGMRSTDTVIYLNGTPLGNVELNVPVSGYAFMNCASIISVSLSGESVGSYAFAYCNNLQDLTLNEGVETVNTNAFMCCAKITELTFPATLTTIGSGAFGAKTSNPKIDGPSITKLTVSDLAAYLQTDWSAALLASGGKIYVGQNEVTSINAAALGVTKIGAYALQNSSVTSVNLTGVTSIGTNAFKDCSVTRIDIDSLNSWLNVEFSNSNPLSATGAKLYINNVETTSLTLTGVIPDYAFYGYSALTSVDLSGVTEIGSNAFYGTGISSVVIGSNTTEIGTAAFYGCTSLEKVTINGNVTIGATAFRNCTSLTTVIIGEGVTSIGANTFNGCTSLTTLVLPKSLETLTNSALTGCTSLTKIYFLGTSEADLKQEGGETAKAWTTVTNVKSKTIYFYSEQTPAAEGNFWHYVDGVPTAYPAVEE